MLDKREISELRKSFNEVNDFLKENQDDSTTNSISILRKLRNTVEISMASELHDLIDTYRDSEYAFSSPERFRFQRMIMGYGDIYEEYKVTQTCFFDKTSCDPSLYGLSLENNKITIFDKNANPIHTDNFENTTTALEQFLRYNDLIQFAKENDLKLLIDDNVIHLNPSIEEFYVQDNKTIHICIDGDHSRCPIYLEKSVFEEYGLKDMCRYAPYHAQRFMFVKYDIDNGDLDVNAFLIVSPSSDANQFVPTAVNLTELSDEETARIKFLIKDMCEEHGYPFREPELSLADQIQNASAHKAEPDTNGKIKEQEL